MWDDVAVQKWMQFQDCILSYLVCRGATPIMTFMYKESHWTKSTIVIFLEENKKTKIPERSEKRETKRASTMVNNVSSSLYNTS